MMNVDKSIWDWWCAFVLRVGRERNHARQWGDWSKKPTKHFQSGWAVQRGGEGDKAALRHPP